MRHGTARLRYIEMAVAPLIAGRAHEINLGLRSSVLVLANAMLPCRTTKTVTVRFGSDPTDPEAKRQCG